MEKKAPVRACFGFTLWCRVKSLGLGLSAFLGLAPMDSGFFLWFRVKLGLGLSACLGLAPMDSGIFAEYPKP